MNKHLIPICNIDELRTRVERIRKKCAKYGCDFYYQEDAPIIVEERVSDDRYYTLTRKVKKVPIEVEAKAVVPGWEFLAVIEHHGAGNVIKAGTNSDEVMPLIDEKYKTCGPWCDHCKQIRSRKDTYLVRNTETGEIKQVGKSCLKDYTNGMDAEHIAWMLSEVKGIEECGDWDMSYRGESKYFDVLPAIEAAVSAVRLFGYVKTRNELDEINFDSTKDRVLDILNEVDPRDVRDRKRKDAIERILEDMENNREANRVKSKEIFDHFAEMTPEEFQNSDYLRNMHILLLDGYLEWKNLGFVVSAVPSYFRFLESEEERIEREERKRRQAEKERSSTYVGQVGERIDIKNAMIHLVTSWDGAYGATYLYKITDESGNIFTWFASSPIGQNNKRGFWEPLDETTSHDFKATVKKHEEYEGVKQTIIQRCKVA